MKGLSRTSTDIVGLVLEARMATLTLCEVMNGCLYAVENIDASPRPRRAETGARADTLVRDAVKVHLDYLEWLGQSLNDAEQEAQQSGWMTSDEVRRVLAAETAGRRVAARGRVEWSPRALRGSDRDLPLHFKR